MTALVECHNSPFGSQCFGEWCKGQRLHNVRVQGDEHAIVRTPIKIREPQGIMAKLKSFRCPQNIALSTQSPHASPVVIPDVQLGEVEGWRDGLGAALFVLGLVDVAGNDARFSFFRTKSVLSCLSHFWPNVVTLLEI